MSDEHPARITFNCAFCSQDTGTIEPTKIHNVLQPDKPHDWWMVVCDNDKCGVSEPIEDDDFLSLLTSMLDCSPYEAIEQTLRAVYLYTQEVVE